MQWIAKILLGLSLSYAAHLAMQFVSALEAARKEKRSKPRPAVLQIIPNLLTIGGAERGTVETATYLANSCSIKSVVLCADASAEHSQMLAASSALLVTCPTISSKNPLDVFYTNVRYIVALCLHNDIDVIHARSRAVAWSALIASRILFYFHGKTNVLFVTTCHGRYRKSWYMRYYNLAIAVWSDVVVVPSYYIAEYTLEHNCHKQQQVLDLGAKMVAIPRGVDLRYFVPVPHSSSANPTTALSELWGIPEKRSDQRFIVMPARLSKGKGHKEFLIAMIELAKNEPNLVGIIVGGGGEHRDVQRWWRRWSYASLVYGWVDECRRRNLNIRLVPGTSDMVAVYSLADVVVMASTRPEAHGRVVLEAVACGKPVVAFDHGGAKETLQTLGGDGDGGGDVGIFLAHPDPPGEDSEPGKELAKQIRRALNSPIRNVERLRRRLAECGYSADAMVEAYKNVYTQFNAS